MAGLGDLSLALTGTGNPCTWTSQRSEPWGKAVGSLLPCWGGCPPFLFVNSKQERDGHGVPKLRCCFSLLETSVGSYLNSMLLKTQHYSDFSVMSYLLFGIFFSLLSSSNSLPCCLGFFVVVGMLCTSDK